MKRVFVNGCFDVLHIGHVKLLQYAKEQGDILVIGLNDDSSIRKLKGPHRPINPLKDRIQFLLALSCVDQVIPFNTDTPVPLLMGLYETGVGPNLVVKGEMYRHATLPERHIIQINGGSIIFYDSGHDISSTNVIERCKKCGKPTTGAMARTYAGAQNDPRNR